VTYQAFFGGNPISNIETGGGNITLNINTSGMSVGNNTVTIQATQLGCGSVTMNNSATLTVLALPSVSITPSSSLSFCEGEDVTLTATSASSYLWSNGATTPSILVDASGTFSVTITDANGCSATSSDVNTVENLNPVPVISANGATTICNGSSVQLVASGGTSYIWSNGATTSSIQASQAGIYNFTAFNGTCSVVSSDIEVFVNPAPSVTANASQTSICLGESVTLTGDGAISYSWNNGVVDGASFVPSITTTYQVTGTDANGCTAQANITVTVNQLPDASFVSSLASFCPGLSSMDLVANNSNHDTYNWYEGANPLQMNGNATITINNAGTFELEVIDNNGCTNSSTLVVNSSSVPSVSISSSNGNFCVGSSELITATFETGANYTWYDGAVMVSGPSSNNTYNASIAGNYMVIMTNAGGCEGTSNTITLTTNPVPVANITSNTTTICAGGSAILSVTPVSGASYQWNLNGNPILGETGTTFTATTSGNYTVEVNDGCSALSNVIVISTGVLPNNAGTISGTSSLCAGESQIFSIGNVVNATSYNWTITPSNAGSISQGQGTNSVTVNTTNTNFTLTVVPQNACGNGGSSQRSVTVSTGGFCAGDIMFAANQTNICEGNQVTFTNYSNPNQFMGLTAAWNFGAGASPATATGNGPHTVTYNTSGLKTVTLSYQDTFGNVFDSETKTNYINVSGVVNTSAISGNNSILCNSNNETYSVIQTSGSSYNWTVPTGATILSGQGSNMITVNMSGNEGAITVVETNTAGCIGNTVTMSVTISNPVVTSVISGPTDVNCDATDLVYSVVNTNGSSYQWTVPSGANINNGQGSNLISVNFNTNFGIITVTETNTDGCVGQLQEITVDCNVGIVNNEGLNISVYPNPVNDYFYLSFNDTFESVALKLYDNMGKIVKSIIVQNQEEINVQDLARGIYYGTVTFENETKSFKIIKQ
jgi:hypothetical protein